MDNFLSLFNYKGNNKLRIVLLRDSTLEEQYGAEGFHEWLKFLHECLRSLNYEKNSLFEVNIG